MVNDRARCEASVPSALRQLQCGKSLEPLYWPSLHGAKMSLAQAPFHDLHDHFPSLLRKIAM